MHAHTSDTFETILARAQDLYARGDYELAEDRFLTALTSAKIAYGKHSAAVGIVALELADFYGQTGDESQARTYLRLAASIMETYYVCFAKYRAS